MNEPYGQYTPGPAPQTNGLGVAGFVVSLVGLVATCGLLSPIGLILSLVGLKREPKGLAIAGVVIGAIGSVGTLLMLVYVVFVIGITATALGMGISGIETTAELATINATIEAEYQQTGSYPASLASLSLTPGMLDDAWGNPYVYTVDPNGTSYTLSSNGPDGIPGNADDLTP